MGLFQFFRWGKKQEKGVTKGASAASCPSRPVSDVESDWQTGVETEPGSGIPRDNRSESVSETHQRAVRWIGPGDTAVVAGRKIGGMLYLDPEPQRKSWSHEGSAFIDPGLPVAKVGSDISGESLPYWPSYSDINPRARATYLDWLAGGRSDKRYSPGYVFLYFYGLERRFFLDTPEEEEKHLLVAEAETLLRIYGGNHSIERYLGTFLDVAHIVLKTVSEPEPLFERSSYELPLKLRVTLGRMAKADLPLRADWLLVWYIAHPEYSLRTPARRAALEFQALFTLLFDERFPGGLKIPKPKRTLRASYSAASGAFDINLNHFIGDIPDISRISRPLNVARKVVDEATDALDKYSRFLGRNPEGRDTIEAHMLLPERLWPLFPCTEMEELRRWAEGVVETGGFSPVEQVIEKLEGIQPEKIAKRQLTQAADALGRLSIGMAPDPRFALRSPKVGEPVVLFRLPKGMTTLERVSDKYKDILITIAMASFVARADGKIAAMERSALESIIDGAELSITERARLLANLEWMLTVPPDLALLRRRLSGVSESAPHEFAQVALAMAAADGAVGSEEIKAIERIYKALGLETDGIYSALHALASRSEPVAVLMAGEPERTFAIPPPLERDSRVVLDDQRVASIMSDTARIATILGDLFKDDQPDEEQDTAMEEDESEFEGLDAKHTAFLGELLAQPHWEEPEFAKLARDFSLMESGALETLNEWAFQRYGDILIEEYEGYDINPDVAAELKI